MAPDGPGALVQATRSGAGGPAWTRPARRRARKWRKGDFMVCRPWPVSRWTSRLTRSRRKAASRFPQVAARIPFRLRNPGYSGRVERHASRRRRQESHRCGFRKREALEFLRPNLPDRDPWYAWSNIEFIDDEGKVNEVDALVLSPHGLFPVEINQRQPDNAPLNASTLPLSFLQKPSGEPRSMTCGLSGSEKMIRWLWAFILRDANRVSSASLSSNHSDTA